MNQPSSFCGLLLAALASLLGLSGTSMGEAPATGGSLALVAEGGSFQPGNLASGKVAFAQDEIGIPPHAISNVTDGTYGNASSWIPNSQNSFIGVVLGSTPVVVSGIAFGRDNLGEYPDRFLGTYTIQYTTAADPAAGTAAWTTIGSVDYGSTGNFSVSAPASRHLFSFPPVCATGIRLAVAAAFDGIGHYMAIDELELYEKLEGQITFNPPSLVTTPGALSLTATAPGNASPVTFALVSGPATLAGNVLMFSGPGAAVVRASTAANANFFAAQTERSITYTYSFQLVTAPPADLGPNLATNKTAFAKDVYPSAPHAVANLNDLGYGNASSWLAFSQNSFAGIALGATPIPVAYVAFGRDNTGAAVDRVNGSYLVEYTTVPNPTAGTTDWTPLGVVDFRPNGNFSVSAPSVRHVFSFPTVSATGIRVAVNAAADSVGSYMAIDELELYGPATVSQAVWRQQYFGTSSNAGNAADDADGDNDGLTNLWEYAFGLNPLAPSVLPSVVSHAGVTGFSFTGVPGVAYGAETSTDLVNWTPVADTGTGNGHVFNLPATEPKRFLRLAVTPVSLTSLSISPGSSSRFLGATQAFTAAGHYSDGTTQDLTSQVTWSSTARAAISTLGVATALETGSATITASLGSVTAAAALAIANDHPSNNETNTPAELDYVALTFPPSFTVGSGNSIVIFAATVQESGFTDPPGASASITCQVGYGPAGTNPATQAGWTWVNAGFDFQFGAEDRYTARIVSPGPGSYRMAARFSRDGVNWTYADPNGAGSNPGLTFSADDLPVLTVTP